MADEPASERVRQRIKAWVEEQGHGAQRELAQAVPAKFGETRSDSWISDILKRRADLSLRDLDAIADKIGVPPGDLVRRPDRNYMELRIVETKLIGYFRALPERVASGWMLWLDYMFQHHKPTGKVSSAWLSPEDETAFRRARKLPK